MQISRTKPLILVVEDEARVASFVRQSLEESGFDVLEAESAAIGEEIWSAKQPDLVVLDLMLPDRDGAELLTLARERGIQTPVLVLSAKSSMSDRVRGLDSGADDYLGKPFGIEELVARVRVLLKRSKDAAIPSHTCADLHIDFQTRRVTRADRVVFLSETEYRLLELMAMKSGEPASKREILSYVWDDPERDDNIVEVYVNYLRSKLERNGASRLVQTARGRGYLLSESEDAT